MKPSTAPVGTLAYIGHPANKSLIYRRADGWYRVATGEPLDFDDFRAGWKLATTFPIDGAEPAFELRPIWEETAEGRARHVFPPPFREHSATENECGCTLQKLDPACFQWVRVG